MKPKRMMMVAAIAAAIWAEAAVNVTDVSFRQRYPWNGIVDIDCTVDCNDPATNISLYVIAKNTAANKSLAVRSIWLESDATHTNALEVQSGTHRLVWDAGKDNPNFVGDAVTVEVQAHLSTELYLVIDLSGGKDADSYPISYLGAEPQGGWTDEYKTTKLVLRRIQPGTFTMGSPEDELGRNFDELQHEVVITCPFFMGIFEVTQKQWQLVMGDNPSSYQGDVRPVECVSYDMLRGTEEGAHWPRNNMVDGNSFIGILRTKTTIAFDLPTEAQWEYACRAGTTTALNSGKDLMRTDDCPNMAEVGRYYYNQNDGKGGYSSSHTKVGSYRPNDWGLYDMHGNVWEWCLDWREDYDMTRIEDPKGSEAGTYRVVRGEGFTGGAWSCRSARRGGSVTSWHTHNNGFRLCYSIWQ